MSSNSLSDRNLNFALIVLSALLTFAIQFQLRSYDDNRLTSWKWAFANENIFWFLAVITLAVFITYFLIRAASSRPGLLLAILSFIISSFFWSVPEVIVDASRYFTQARHLELYGTGYFAREWGGSINAWTDMPLAPFLYGVLFKVFGGSRGVIQVFTSLLFSLTAVLVFLTGRRLWDEETGLAGGLLFMGIPYIYSQTPLMLVDVPTMFFLTLSVFTFIKALEEGGHWIAASAVSIFCAVLVKYSTWMMLSILPVIFIVYLIKGREAGADRRGEVRVTISRGVSVALIALALTGSVLIYKYDVITAQIAFLREYQAPGLRRWGESFASTFLYQTHPFITIAALYSTYAAFKKRDPKFLIISWLFIIIVAAQIKRSRYVLVAFPMLALMASYGLQRIRQAGIKRLVISCVIASSLVVALFAYRPFLKNMSLVNIMEAGGYLDSVKAGSAEVFTVYSGRSVVNPAVAVPILDLFTESEIAYHHDPGFTLPFKKIEKSPLRFTWEYENPEYYSPDKSDREKKPAIVIVSNGPLKELPGGASVKIDEYKAARIFNTSTGIFRYNPTVSVYLPKGSGN